MRVALQGAIVGVQALPQRNADRVIHGPDLHCHRHLAGAEQIDMVAEKGIGTGAGVGALTNENVLEVPLKAQLLRNQTMLGIERMRTDLQRVN